MVEQQTLIVQMPGVVYSLKVCVLPDARWAGYTPLTTPPISPPHHSHLPSNSYEGGWYRTLPDTPDIPP